MTTPPNPGMDDRLETARRRLFDRLAHSGRVGPGPTLAAMRQVRRELFVPEVLRPLAYCNIPLSIGHGQTISQPQMVAAATAALQLRGDERVLEVGAGSGYQAAILGELLPFGHALAVERIPALAAAARRNLTAAGIDNVSVHLAGPVLGAPDHAPFDAILVSAAAPSVPDALLAQLAPAGRIVIPVGSRDQQTLTQVRLTPNGPTVRELGHCRYVPLLGPGGWPAET